MVDILTISIFINYLELFYFYYHKSYEMQFFHVKFHKQNRFLHQNLSRRLKQASKKSHKIDKGPILVVLHSPSEIWLQFLKDPRSTMRYSKITETCRMLSLQMPTFPSTTFMFHKGISGPKASLLDYM